MNKIPLCRALVAAAFISLMPFCRLGDEKLPHLMPKPYRVEQKQEVKQKQQEVKQYRVEQKPEVKQKNTSPYSKSGAISNDFFTDHTYMTATDIQRILEEKQSCLTNRGIERVIMESAEKYKINPLLILARLQVEKSLIEKKHAKPKELKYATGYGVFDKGKKLPSKGINDQIEKTAEYLRDFYSEFDNQTIKINYEKTEIKPKNAATYALFRYTPHTSGYNLNRKVLERLIKFQELLEKKDTSRNNPTIQ